ncbi:MAG: sigma-70 family RNA polymerase sigma factor [Clostridia bacterium]|nr:sigma-70 family RNA polymerase sigma factor [Clostridia bacterium]
MSNLTAEKKILPDEEIVDLYWERNELAIEATDDKYQKYLYKIAYNILNDRLDCEECINDTYLGTWNTIPPARPNAFRNFLTRIMRNVSMERYRKKTAKKRIRSEMTVSLEELDDCVSFSAPSVEEEFAVREISKILSEYLRTLPTRQEFAFICRYYCADYVADIAKMLDVSPNTVYRDLATMREELKNRLKEAGYYHE